MKIKGKIIAFATKDGNLNEVSRNGDIIIIELATGYDKVPVGKQVVVR